MKNWINTILVYTLALFALFFACLPAGMALAQVGGIANNGLSFASLGISIVNAIWIIFTIIAVIAFLVAGILFLTSGGDAERIAKARSAFIWGVVGIIVGLLAFTIIAVIRNAIGA